MPAAFIWPIFGVYILLKSRKLRFEFLARRLKRLLFALRTLQFAL